MRLTAKLRRFALKAPFRIASAVFDATHALIVTAEEGRHRGRGEAEGGGFRDVIAEAVGQGIPVLTAVRPDFADAWQAFGGEAACEVSADLDAITDWLARARNETAPA